MSHLFCILIALVSCALSASTECIAAPSINQDAPDQNKSDIGLSSKCYKLAGEAQGQPRKKAIKTYSQILVSSDSLLVNSPNSYEALYWRCVALEAIGDLNSHDEKSFELAMTNYQLATHSSEKCLELHQSAQSYRLNALAQLGIGRIEWFRRHHAQAKSAFYAALKSSGAGLELQPANKSTLFGCQGQALLYLGFSQVELHEDNQAKDSLLKSIIALKAALAEMNSETLSTGRKVAYLNCEALAFRRIGYLQIKQGDAPTTSFNSAIEAADAMLNINPNSHEAKAMKKDVGEILSRSQKNSSLMDSDISPTLVQPGGKPNQPG